MRWLIRVQRGWRRNDPQSARAQTIGVFALMVGTLQVSRALADRRLADDVLEQGIQNALALLGAEQRVSPSSCLK